MAKDEQVEQQDVPDTRNPNQGTDDAVDKTRYETVDTNAGADAADGGVAKAEPTDIGGQKPMDDFGTGE